MFNVDDYRLILIEQLNSRKNKNPAYSARAFARDIGLSPQMLNRVLRGQSGISAHVASEIAEKLNFDAHDRELFIALAESRHARSADRRATATSTILALRSKERQNPFIYDHSKKNSLGHWAASVLVDLTNFKSDLDWIAKQLGVSKELANEFVESMIKQGFFERDIESNVLRSSRYRRDQVHQFYYPDAGTRKEYGLSRNVIYETLFSDKDGNVIADDAETMLIAIDREQAQEIRAKIQAEFKKILNEYSLRAPKRDQIFALSFSMYPLTDRPASLNQADTDEGEG
jgi:uncharacterized protein (TIGR02147 family)